MVMTIAVGIVVALLMLAVQFVAFVWFDHWASTLPPTEQKKAWEDYYWLSTAESPEEQARIMKWRRELE
ncbi:MAG TPA: hypothetical protein VJ869_06630 [Sphaerochaeta sp.]|nr:hypothetical protein [Sphaerochaeta sp.]